MKGAGISVLKLLLKKQLYELYRSFFYNQKKGKMRSVASSVAFIVLYVLLMVGVLGGLFAYFAFSACGPMTESGAGWLYFAVFGLLAIAMGTFGSVFNTSAALYKAGDNDLLLSMPIPVGCIVASRLLSTYLLGLMYSGIVILPVSIVYMIVAGATVYSVLGTIVSLIIVSAVVLILSCVLGWVVAKISEKLKNKSFITVIISLVALGAYYFFYFKASELLQSLVENVNTVAASVKGSAYPLYAFGRACEGSPAAAAAFIGGCAVLIALTIYIISKTFISTATASDGGTSKKSAKGRIRAASGSQKSLGTALLSKEFGRLTHSPGYMLNCALGTVFILCAAVFVFIKGAILNDILSEAFGTAGGAVIFAAVMCALSSMNDTAAPSVSLEGNTVWILQSLPVDMRHVLRAKLKVQLLITNIPMLLCSIASIAAIRPDPVCALMLILLPQFFSAALAAFGLAMGLKKPNLSWTNEMIPIKQSMPIMLALFGGWIMAVIYAVLYLAVGHVIGGAAYMAIACAVFAAIAVFLIVWIERKGAKILAHLN